MLRKLPAQSGGVGNSSTYGSGGAAMMSGDAGVSDPTLPSTGTLPWNSAQFMRGSGSSTPSNGDGGGGGGGSNRDDIIVGLVTPRFGQSRNSNNKHNNSQMIQKYSPVAHPQDQSSNFLAASFGSLTGAAPWKIGGSSHYVSPHHQDRTPQVDPLNLPSMFLSTRSAPVSYNPNSVGSFASAAADQHRRPSLVSAQLRASTTFVDGGSSVEGASATGGGASTYKQHDSTSPTAQHLFPSYPQVALYGADASFESQLLFRNSQEAEDDGVGGLFRHLVSSGSPSQQNGASDQQSLSSEGGGHHPLQLPPSAAIPYSLTHNNTNNQPGGGGGVGALSTLWGDGVGGGDADSTLRADTHFLRSVSSLEYSGELPKESPTSAPLAAPAKSFTHTLAFD